MLIAALSPQGWARVAFLILISSVPAIAQVATKQGLATSSAGGLRLAEWSLQDLALPTGSPAECAVPLAIDGVKCALLLERRSLRAPSFQLLAQDASGRIAPHPAPPPCTYRGRVVFPGRSIEEDGAVAATLKDGALAAVLRLADGSLVGVQPLREADPLAPPCRHAVYRLEEVLSEGEVCGVLSPEEPEPRPGEGPGGSTKAAVAPLVAELALDADCNFHALCGGSLAGTLADIESVVNGAEVIYATEVAITFSITTVLVRTAEPDPYSASDPLQLLGQIEAEWSGPLAGIGRDVVHLFTGKDLDGVTVGFASIGVVCSPAHGCSLAQSRYTANLASRVALCAHELGHNFGATHCSGSDCHIMCATIGGCGGGLTVFGAQADQQIEAFAATAPCLAPASGSLSLPFADSFALPQVEWALWESGSGMQVALNGGEPSAPYSLALDASGPAPAQQDEIVSRPIALAGHAGARLSFQARHSGVEAGEALVVEYYASSQQWLELKRVSSNGSPQSQFAAHEQVLPADALHDAFRLRLCTEVSDASDDWFVDDVRVQPAPLGAPVISAITPSAVTAFAGGQVTLLGSGFSAAGAAVKIGGVPLSSFTVVHDGAIQFDAPTATALGPAAVIVSTSQGSSVPASLTFLPTDPPKLAASPFVFNGQSLLLSWGGEPGDALFILCNVTGQTLPFSGGTLLANALVVPFGGLDAVGTGMLSAPISGVPMGTFLYMQILTVDPPGLYASTAKASNVAVTVVLF
ncbi:MAG: IPT/TIG domain-containing protein [Planctomycetes bacterium]|nr:IPT/TIG domain-containing protein [Planctomycetota bacterium]